MVVVQMLSRARFSSSVFCFEMMMIVTVVVDDEAHQTRVP